MKMMNQFSAVYGQLFCCDCPGALTNVKCDNKTGVVIAYPVLAQTNYSWLAGLICLLMLTTATIVATVLYCRKKRRSRQADLISIIRFQDNLRSADVDDGGEADQQTDSLVNSNFRNPGFLENDEVEVMGRLALTTSASEESLDSPLLIRTESLEDSIDIADSCSRTTFPPEIFRDHS